MKLQMRKDNLMKDIIAGIIVALVSIPISMGYAQVAGLPAACADRQASRRQPVRIL